MPFGEKPKSKKATSTGGMPFGEKTKSKKATSAGGMPFGEKPKYNYHKVLKLVRVLKLNNLM